ncbi:MAG: S24 family peptidase [Pseudomonadota bacterium]|nr:S24 family peptidase [Pseudomonadota bacterium]
MLTGTELGEALRKAIELKGVKKVDVANHFGVKPPSVQDWLKRGVIAKDKLPELWAYFSDVVGPEHWGLSSISPSVASSAWPPLVDLDEHPDLVPVRSVKLRLRCGVQGFAVEPDSSDGIPIFFRREWFAERGYNPARLIAIKVKDASMEPTLYDGDMVVINTADTQPKDGQVYAINHAGEPVVKRLMRLGPDWWMHSDNPNQQRYPRVQCNEDCIVVGRVAHRQSERI